LNIIQNAGNEVYNLEAFVKQTRFMLLVSFWWHLFYGKLVNSYQYQKNNKMLMLKNAFRSFQADSTLPYINS